MVKIIPAILTDSEEELANQLNKAQEVVDLVQIDITDSEFTSNKTVGINSILKYKGSLKMEVQLMVNDPEKFVKELLETPNVLRIIVPVESTADLEDLIIEVKQHSKEIGLSLNPNTPVSRIPEAVRLDMILLLAVNPGFSGQKFQDRTLDKIREVKSKFKELKVEVDGGINFENAKSVVESGADFLAVNSALFKASDFKKAFKRLSYIIES